MKAFEEYKPKPNTVDAKEACDIGCKICLIALFIVTPILYRISLFLE